MARIYLDHAATTPTRHEVVEAMLPYYSDTYGNPSSLHSEGRAAREAVEEARWQVASLIRCEPQEIVFTSGGTEADNLAIKGIARANRDRGNHIITTTIEHHAVIEACQSLVDEGYEVDHVPVDACGVVDPGDIEAAITDRTILVSVMHANNEIGTIEPIEEIAALARRRGICFHTDAVQSAGRVPINVGESGVDLLAMSAHKMYGPKGIGALFIRRGTKILPLLHGGAQELGLRSSTENVPGIVGFGRAAALAREEMAAESARQASLRDRLIRGLLEQIEGIRLNGHPSNRLPNNVNIGVDSAEGQSMAVMLDAEGIAVSTGSACNSGVASVSHVLQAIGLPMDMARGSLRFTLGRSNSEEDVQRVLDVLPRIVARLRSLYAL